MSLRHIATEPSSLSQQVLKISNHSNSDGKHVTLKKSHKNPVHTNSDSDLSGRTSSPSHDSTKADSNHHPKNHNNSQQPTQHQSTMRAPLALHLTTVNGPLSVPGQQQQQKDQDMASEHSSSVRYVHRNSEWEILEGLKEGQHYEEKPDKIEGFLLKRRKWPLKGWHKRYFSLDKGILTYAKTSTEMARGKMHGFIDVGLSVISTKGRDRRLDIDAEEYIHHLKVKNRAQFLQWLQALRMHRLYRQNEIAYGSREAPKITTPVDEGPYGGMGSDTPIQHLNRRESCWLVRTPISQQNRVAAWILDSSAIEQGNRDLSNLQDKLFQLTSLLHQLEVYSSLSSVNAENVENGGLKEKKRRFLRKNKKWKKKDGVQKPILKNSKGVEIIVSQDQHNENLDDGEESVLGLESLSTSQGFKESCHLSTSHPMLNDNEWETCCSHHNESTATSNAPMHKCHEDFLLLAKSIHSGLRSTLRGIQTERERLKQLLENESLHSGNTGNTTAVANLKNTLSQVMQQNSELQMRLIRIRAETEVANFTVTSPGGGDSADDTIRVHQPLQPSLSHESSSALSNSEYFDAEENPSACSSSSEGTHSDEESFCSEVSDEGTEYTPNPSEITPTVPCITGRRSKLPVPKPDTGDFSLWNLLCKNIGKDLSKVCMPVTINEPLNMLQRLCEELEYSELLDKAADTIDPYERMVYVAAFAVSAYSSSLYRAGHKPFNPLLGETYECIREDKGFRFLAEQVSHHPPVSACHAESKNFIFWQDVRIKTKFWGKSMEIVPIGSVQILFPRTSDQYRWNKVTTCVHNLFSNQRWVDQYGEMVINTATGDATCKLTFVKASYWSNKRYEVHGSVMNRQGEVVHQLFGKWNEALYCGVAPSAKCVWRPGVMPEDNDMYYGFTRFAIELNELDPEMSKYLPPTDTRFRPDQRLLEEGNFPGAESTKQQVEQSQRERRKKREETGMDYIPMWFSKEMTEDKHEEWVFNNKYWDVRNNPGFVNVTFPQKLW